MWNATALAVRAIDSPMIQGRSNVLASKLRIEERLGGNPDEH